MEKTPARLRIRAPGSWPAVIGVIVFFLAIQHSRADQPPPTANLTKAAFWPDGTPFPTGAVVPSGMEFKYRLYVNNANSGRTDVSISAALDPLFQYQSSTVQVDNTVAECAAAVCTPAAEQAIFNSINKFQREELRLS